MTDLLQTRRGFIRGAGLILAAPAIVRFSSLMPVKAIAATVEDPRMVWTGSEMMRLDHLYQWMQAAKAEVALVAGILPESALAPRGRD